MEVCFCGWMGDLEDRTPIYGRDADDWALACPLCGRIDRVAWLTDHDRRAVLAEVERRLAVRSAAQPEAQTITAASVDERFGGLASAGHGARWLDQRNQVEG